MGVQATAFPRSTGDASYRAGRKIARLALPAAAAVLALGVLAGCAAAPGAGGATDDIGARDGIGRAGPPSSGNPEKALAGWQSFPVSASPRPLVLTAGRVLDPSTGFATSEDKLAYLAGNYDLATALPTGPSTSGGYAVISAKAALGQLRVNASGQQVSSRLKIVKVSLTHAKFNTDRGPQLLPAWQFTLAGVTDSARVLAVAQSELWPAKPVTEPTWPTEQASVAADDQSVSYSFYASPAGPSPCGASYGGKVTESPTAAVIYVEELKPNPAGGSTSANQACAAIAAQRTVTVRLAAPLGSRVLLTAQGSPIAVVKR